MKYNEIDNRYVPFYKEEEIFFTGVGIIKSIENAKETTRFEIR